MGLLNKIQEKKIIKEQETIETEIINQTPQTETIQEKPKEKIRQTKGKKDEPIGLLHKAPIIKKLYFDKKNSVLIEEKKGFGYNRLASRRILQDKSSKVYFYEITEPVLTEVEIDIKTELTHLFKMLADVNVANMTEEEKNKFLQETLDQIVIDNDIDFNRKIIIKTDEEKTKEKKPWFSKKTNEKKDKPKTFSKTKDKKTNKKTKQELTEEEKKIKEKIYYHLFRDFLGYNKIDILMKDEGIEDISCDGHQVPIFIYHKKYDAITTNIKFDDEKELNSFVVRLAQICGN